jgi:hypothetical protein
MEANQNTTNINRKKKGILPTEELIINKTVLCGLAIRSVNIITEMPTAENSIRYRALIDRNKCYRRALKKWNI